MKKIVFLCSHLHSGSAALYEAMNNHSRIQGFLVGRFKPYVNSLSLLDLVDQRHKTNNRSAIYMDELLNNKEFCVKAAYKECKFIYILREPEPTLNFMINNTKIKPAFAVRYYTYRLRRLFEMAKRTPEAVLLTWSDLLAGRISLIEEYLNLKEHIPYIPELLSPFNFSVNSTTLNRKSLLYAENSYEKYLYLIKKENISKY